MASGCTVLCQPWPCTGGAGLRMHLLPACLDRALVGGLQGSFPIPPRSPPGDPPLREAPGCCAFGVPNTPQTARPGGPALDDSPMETLEIVPTSHVRRVCGCATPTVRPRINRHGTQRSQHQPHRPREAHLRALCEHVHARSPMRESPTRAVTPRRRACCTMAHVHLAESAVAPRARSLAGRTCLVLTR